MNISQDSTMFASAGECNFSGLSLSELVFLHWYIRNRFEKDLRYQDSFKAMIFDRKKKKPYFLYGYPKSLSVNQVDKISDCISVFSDLFGWLPKIMVNQTSDMKLVFQHLYYDWQSNKVLLTNQPDQVGSQKTFLTKLRKQRRIKKREYERLIKQPLFNVLVSKLRTDSYSTIQKIIRILESS